MPEEVGEEEHLLPKTVNPDLALFFEAARLLIGRNGRDDQSPMGKRTDVTLLSEMFCI